MTSCCFFGIWLFKRARSNHAHSAALPATSLFRCSKPQTLILLYCLSIFKKGAQQRIQNCFWACMKNAWAITKKQAWSTSCIPGKSKKVVKWLKEMVTQPEILDLRASVSKYLLCCQYISLNLFQLSNNTCRNFLCYNERTTDTMSVFMHDDDDNYLEWWTLSKARFPDSGKYELLCFFIPANRGTITTWKIFSLKLLTAIIPIWCGHGIH